MKVYFVIVLVALCSFAYVEAQGNGPRGTPDPAMAAARTAMEKLKVDYDAMKAAGKIDDKKLIDSFKSAIALMQAGKDKAAPEAQAHVTKHIADAQAKLATMTTSGKFDETVFLRMG